MLARRPIAPSLAASVRTLWYSEGASHGAQRERVLPTGTIHLAFRHESLRIFDGEDDASGREVGRALVGGPRAAYYLRDVSRPVPTIGVQLCAAASERLLGLPASELAGRHVPLEDLWGGEAKLVHERLFATADPGGKLEILESFLLRRLGEEGGNPAIEHALGRLEEGVEVGAVVRESGYSHRHFVSLFHRAVGLQPKLYARVARLQRALRIRRGGTPWAEVAHAAGYADQPHLSRDFREIAGLSPGRYGRLGASSANHVPWD